MLNQHPSSQDLSYHELKIAFLNSQEYIKNLEKRLEQYQLAYEQMQHQINELLRHRFGARSERFIDEESLQLELFPAAVIPPSEPEATVTVAEHTRTTSHKKKQIDYPRVIEIIPVSDEEKCCTCGCQKTVIRYETKELFDYQPAIIRMLEQRREVVACTKGCEGSK